MKFELKRVVLVKKPRVDEARTVELRVWAIMWHGRVMAYTFDPWGLI